jgi:hypothetical protein
MNFNELIDKAKDIGINISSISKDKINTYIRDKAYKEVVKESINKGINLETMEADDIEYLVAEKEKKITDKINNMGLGAMATYLGFELGGI